MIETPWFWSDKSRTAAIIRGALTPVAQLYQLAALARRKISVPNAYKAPVICVGNATVGGIGKSPFAILLCRLLKERGYQPQFLTRGYGGALQGPLQVNRDKHLAFEVGDEALLLAAHAPTWVSRNRATGATAAIKAGAPLLIMDDGYQNPTIKKDIHILLLPAEEDYRETALFPAGPLREPINDARNRADLECRILPCPPQDNTASGQTAWLEPVTPPTEQNVLAFCGIGRPERFFEMLNNLGYRVCGQVAYPDHHPYTDVEIAALLKKAKQESAALITTEKDYVRINPEKREDILTLPVMMRCDDENALVDKIEEILKKRETS